MKKVFWKSWPFLVLVLLVALAVSTMEGLLSIQTMKAVDAVYANQQEGFYTSVRQMLLTALILVPLTVLLAGVRGFYKKHAIVRMKHYYMNRLFQKSMSAFQKDNNARYLSAVTNDLNTIETAYIDSIYEIVVNTVGFVVGVIVIGTVSPYALGLGVFVGLVSTLLSVLIGKPLQVHQQKRSEMYSDFTAYMKEMLGAFQIIRSNDLSQQVRADYYKRSKDIQHRGYVIDKIMTYVTAFNRLNFNLAFFALVGVTAYMGIKGALSIGGVILVVTSMEKILQPISQMSEIFPKLFGTKPVFQRLDESLETHDALEEAIQLKGFEVSIELKGIHFGYEDNIVFKGASWTIDKGRKYLVVGPSGGGKSTLLKLLRKYFDPQKGDITVDGVPLKHITKESFYSKIANVEQQIFLFEDTIRNNLTLYKDYGDDAVKRAMSQAGLDLFLENLEYGLDTMLYDNGKNLSGGERSRMAIARALLQEAEIIFMDEAFSSLDYATAMGIERTLLGLPEVTVVNVSHVTFEQTKDLYDQVITVKNKGIFSKVKSA